MSLWNTEKVQELLQEPQKLLKDSFWQTWMTTNGGLTEVYKNLRDLPLSSSQKQLLELLLEHPGHTAHTYADMLHVHFTTYYRHLKQLSETICDFLNHRQGSGSIDYTAPLPQPITPLIGRGALVEQCITLLNRSRLVTLAGIGGTGKTRVVLAVGEQLQTIAQVMWVSLDVIQSADFFLPTLVQAFGIREGQMASLEQLVLDYIRNQQTPLVLIIDSFEYALEWAPFLLELLEASALLRILVTSRHTLRVIGENVLFVPPLSLNVARNTPTAKHRCSAAAEVFIQRAQAVTPQWVPAQAEIEYIEQICTNLEGIPLAIEIMAPWVRVLAPIDILKRLEQRFEFWKNPTIHVPERQQTLESLVEWNFQLLQPPVQAMFLQLSMFVAPWGLEQAEVIVEHDSDQFMQYIMQLQDACLIQCDPQTRRWSMLQTLREYALPRLQQSLELLACYERWFNWFHTQLDALPTFSSAEHETWFSFIEREYANCRAIIFWAYDFKPVIALELCGHLWRFWWSSGRLSEGRTLLKQSLAKASVAPFKPHVRALNGLGALCWSQGDWLEARQWFQKCMDLQLHHDDKPGAAATLNNLGLVAIRQQEYTHAIEIFEQNSRYFQEQGLMYAYAASLSNLGVILMYQQAYAQAQGLFEQSLQVRQAEGNAWAIAASLTNLGRVLFLQEQTEAAWPYYLKSLRLLYELEEREIQAECLEGIASILMQQTHYERAIQCLALAQHLRDSIGAPLHEPELTMSLELIRRLKHRVGVDQFIIAHAVGFSMQFKQMVRLLESL